MLNYQWVSNGVLELYTNSTGGANLGCGVYFEGKWHFYSGRKQILSDITFLELVPIFLAICLWKFQFTGMRIKLSCDNQAVVQILNIKSSRSERVMSLVREISMQCISQELWIKLLILFLVCSEKHSRQSLHKQIRSPTKFHRNSGSICRRSRLFSKCIIGWEHGKVVQIGGSTVWCALHRI